MKHNMSYERLNKLKQLTLDIERKSEVLAVLTLAERDSELCRAAATSLLRSIEERNALQREPKVTTSNSWEL